MTNTQMSDIIKALEVTWASIQFNNENVQPALLTVRRPKRAVRGSYAPRSWSTKNGETMDEVFVSSEIVPEGAESVMRTLLHEAVHSLASATGVRDVSNKGHYHNKHFKRLAEQMGLLTEKIGAPIGIVTPGLTPEALLTYNNEIIALEAALSAYQEPIAKVKKAPSTIKIVCECGRKLRVSPRFLAAGDITCNVCESLFEVDV